LGGSTTSKAPTAVRIAPEYSQTTVHVVDASRVVGVASDLLDAGRRQVLDRDNRELQERLREQHAGVMSRVLRPFEEARANRLWLDFSDLPVPSFVGTRVVEPSVATLREHIDWTFFFHSWELKGRFPAILDHPEMGSAARDLYAAALGLLDELEAAAL